PAAHHGGAAVTIGKSVACIWPGVVTGDFASRHERDLFARRAAGGRARVRARSGARVAFRTFRSDPPDAATDVVSRVLRPVHDFSVCFPSAVRRKNRPLGDSSARWSIAFLSYLRARSHCISQRSSRFDAGGICAASFTWIVRAGKTHTTHEPVTKRATGALRRRGAV